MDPPYREPMPIVPDPRAVAWATRRFYVRSVRRLVFGSAAFQMALWMAYEIWMPCDRGVQLNFVVGWFLGLCVQACCVPAATIVLMRYPGERAIVGYATLAAAILFPVAIFVLISNAGRCILG